MIAHEVKRDGSQIPMMSSCYYKLSWGNPYYDEFVYNNISNNIYNMYEYLMYVRYLVIIHTICMNI